MAHLGRPDNWADYEEWKIRAIKDNNGPLTGDVAAQLATCEAQYAATEKAIKRQAAEFEAASEKVLEERFAEAKKHEAEEKKLRALLRGDRVRLYDTYGKPSGWAGDLDTTPTWNWVNTKKRMGYEADCWTYVQFNGNKKVKEWQIGESCKR